MAVPVVVVVAVIVTVIVCVNVVTVFPRASCAVTWIAGDRLVPATALAGGCTVNASCVAPPTVMSKAALVVLSKPEVAVSV